MIKNKKLNKIIDQFVRESFDPLGRLIDEKVREHTKILNTLSGTLGLVSLQEYSKKLQKQMRRGTLRIDSYLPLSTSQMQVISDFFKKDFFISSVVNEVNPDLLGGVRIQIADTVFDDSVSRKIIQLKEAVSSS